MKALRCFSMFLLILSDTSALCAQPGTDSFRIDYKKLYAYAYDGNIAAALSLLPPNDAGNVSAADASFALKFRNRFAFSNDRSEFLQHTDPGINEILEIYRSYWRQSVLDHAHNFDSVFIVRLVKFLKGTGDSTTQSKWGIEPLPKADVISKFLKGYIESKGMHTAGFGRTGAYYDLLLWKTQTDSTYRLNLNGDSVQVHVVFMDDFLSYGWGAYCTLGRSYPAGWATRQALYCVRSAYDLNSERFRLGYLGHEGRHFADYNLFPKLSSEDLEYRAKLLEVSVQQTILFKSIDYFITNANYESANAHSIANFCVIRDLSRVLFKNDFEKDITKWQQLSVKRINTAGKKLLKQNTKQLKKKGTDVTCLIKCVQRM